MMWPEPSVRSLLSQSHLPPHQARKTNSYPSLLVLVALGGIKKGYSCASSTFDYSYLFCLCDHISLSLTASKEAAKALKRELKYSDSAIVQERAVRLMGIMCRNSDSRFKRAFFFCLFVCLVSVYVTVSVTGCDEVAFLFWKW